MTIPTPLSESEQRELWSKYSCLVPYVQLSLPDDQPPSRAEQPPQSIDEAIVSGDQSVAQSGLAQKPQEPKTSSTTPSVLQDISVCSTSIGPLSIVAASTDFSVCVGLTANNIQYRHEEEEEEEELLEAAALINTTRILLFLRLIML